jgi:hypothetical protein
MPVRNFMGKTAPGDHESWAYPGFTLPAVMFASGLSQAS